MQDSNVMQNLMQCFVEPQAASKRVDWLNTCLHLQDQLQKLHGHVFCFAFHCILFSRRISTLDSSFCLTQGGQCSSRNELINLQHIPCLALAILIET